MNKLTNITFAITSLLLGCTTAIAKDAPQHSFGMELSGGSAEYKDSSSDGDGVAELYGHYNYTINRNLSLEVGLATAIDIDDWKCKEDKNDEDKWVCTKDKESLFDLGADKLTYHNAVFAAKGTWPINEKQSIYGKLGAQYYDYEIKKRSSVVRDDSGLGLLLAAGWQYRWDMGLGLNVGLKYQNMNDLKVVSSAIGLNYSF